MVKALKQDSGVINIWLERSWYETDEECIKRINKLLKEHRDFDKVSIGYAHKMDTVCSGCGKPWEPEKVTHWRAMDWEEPKMEGKTICAYCAEEVEP